jgi:PIN like domain
LAGQLEIAGFVVRVHDAYFKRDEADDVWLAECGQRRWVVITPDKRILRDPVSMRAIGANKCRVLFVPKNNKNPQIWAPILKSCWAELNKILKTRTPPFVANISPNGIWGVRELSSRGTEKKKRKNPRHV